MLQYFAHSDDIEAARLALRLKNVVHREIDRLASLVNGLLLLARADAGEVEIRREPVDLSKVARYAARARPAR